MKKIVFVVLLSSVFLGGCASGSDDASTIKELQNTVSSLKKENEKLKSGQGTIDNSTSTTESSTADESANSLVKGLNDPVTFSNPDTKAPLAWMKVVRASASPAAFPEYMHSVGKYDVNNMIAVTVEYKNEGLEENFYASRNEFVAFDASGKAYEQTMQQEGQDMLGIGRGSTSTFYWIVPNASAVNEIEIDYTPHSFYGVKPTTFKVPVEH